MIDSLENALKDRVLDFVARETGAKRSKLSMRTSLLHDLKLDGEDAYWLVVKFSQQFNIDIETFTFYKKCFNKENPFDVLLIPIAVLIELYLRFRKPSKFKKIPLTISTMCLAAKDGHWEEPTDSVARFSWEKKSNLSPVGEE
jgi:acyl carrier protein